MGTRGGVFYGTIMPRGSACLNSACRNNAWRNTACRNSDLYLGHSPLPRITNLKIPVHVFRLKQRHFILRENAEQIKVRDEFTLEVPIGITVQCISIGTSNLTSHSFLLSKNALKIPIRCIGSDWTHFHHTLKLTYFELVLVFFRCPTNISTVW